MMSSGFPLSKTFLCIWNDTNDNNFSVHLQQRNTSKIDDYISIEMKREMEVKNVFMS